MAYTPPSSTAANFAQTGVAYTAPSSTAANFTFVTTLPTVTVTGSVALGDVVAVGAVTFGLTTTTISGAVTIGDVAASGAVTHGVSFAGSPEVPAINRTGQVAHGVSFTGAPAITPLAAVGALLHPRYSVKGEVRNAGVLVNRTVRAYSRDTGELVGSQFTSVGRFDIHTGFAEHEYYVMPIDLDSGADDFIPPVANRVLSVLAVD